MGYLQNDTNNIVIDAVLTDVGRQFLARNDGSFSVVKFACADDGVIYNIIKQYGRTVGKEKIEKNTPVFEAMTIQSNELKSKLISISNPNLIRLPSLSLSGPDVGTDGVVSMGRITKKSSTLTISQTISNENSIDVELRDQTFLLEMNNLFLQLARSAPDSVDGNQKASYILTRSPSETATGGSTVTFTLNVRSLTDAQFTIYGSTANKNIIKSYLKITGLQSGGYVEFACTIDKTQ
jgi:hypothetical protein